MQNSKFNIDFMETYRIYRIYKRVNTTHGILAGDFNLNLIK